jgi:hypothetical protein
MTKDEFRSLFIQALDAAAERAETTLQRQVPHTFTIELHAPACSGKRLSIDQAVDQVYLGSDRFYQIIDLAIRRVLPHESIAFVRVSGHPPAPFSQTWDPSNLGPFKQILTDPIDQDLGSAG